MFISSSSIVPCPLFPCFWPTPLVDFSPYPWMSLHETSNRIDEYVQRSMDGGDSTGRVQQFLPSLPSAASTSFPLPGVIPLPVKKNAKTDPTSAQKDIPKGNKDKHRIRPESSGNNKRKLENTGQKHVRTSRGMLLSGSLDAVFEELKEGRLERAEEVREEKRQLRINIKEQRIHQWARCTNYSLMFL